MMDQAKAAKRAIRHTEHRRSRKSAGVLVLAALFIFGLSDVHSPIAADASRVFVPTVSPCGHVATADVEIRPACPALTPDHPPALLKSSGQSWYIVQTAAHLVRPRGSCWQYPAPAPVYGAEAGSEPSLARAPPA